MFVDPTTDRVEDGLGGGGVFARQLGAGEDDGALVFQPVEAQGFAEDPGALRLKTGGLDVAGRFR